MSSLMKQVMRSGALALVAALSIAYEEWRNWRPVLLMHGR